MPIKSCTLNGQKGFKFGDAGVCNIGTDAKDKARKQGLAILSSMAKQSGVRTKKQLSDFIEKHKSEFE